MVLQPVQTTSGRGGMFVHEHGMGSPDKCLREVGKCLDFGPSTVIPLLTVSGEESTRDAEKGTGFKYFLRGQHKTSARAKAGGEE